MVVRICVLKVAVMTTLTADPFPVAVNVALTLPADTTTLDGTLRAMLLVVRVMVVFDNTEWLRVIVHVVEDFVAIVEGLQVNVLSSIPATGISRIMLVVATWGPTVAVMVAIDAVRVLSEPVVAEKVALFCPECTATLAGTLSAALLLCKTTAV